MLRKTSKMKLKTHVIYASRKLDDVTVITKEGKSVVGKSNATIPFKETLKFVSSKLEDNNGRVKLKAKGPVHIERLVRVLGALIRRDPKLKMDSLVIDNREGFLQTNEIVVESEFRFT